MYIDSSIIAPLPFKQIILYCLGDYDKNLRKSFALEAQVKMSTFEFLIH